MNPSASAPLQFGPQLDVAAHSCAAAQPLPHLENQDNYLLIDHDGRAVSLQGQRPLHQQVSDWPRGHARLAVLDGMGGHGQGRQAAEAVVAGLLAMPACDSLEQLCRRLDLLHTQLQRQFGADAAHARRPGTTLTLLELRPEQPALLYHVGDSRLYQLADALASPLTVDHVPATAYAMAGLLGEQEWWQQVHGEHRSQISQAFILGNAIGNTATLSDPLLALTPDNLPPFLAHLPDRRAVALRPGATYLLATDGFWACAEPFGWVARWPGLLGAGAGTSAGMGAHAACDALFAEFCTHPPASVHADNLTAVVIRVTPTVEETALPQPAVS